MQDEKAAFGWLSLAARSGNAIAQNRLAKMLALGVGTKADGVEAAKWYILSRRQGLHDDWLDEFIAKLDQADRKKALDAVRDWPSS